MFFDPGARPDGRVAGTSPATTRLPQTGSAALLARRLAVVLVLRLLLGLEVLAGLLVDDLHREPHLAALVEAEQLDLDLVAFLDDVAGLLHAPRRELADVDEAVARTDKVHEGAEVHHL